ncbi:MAG: HAD-IB family hydrolase [Streptosporangiaceae bacterium]|nr:HAD-IB family hydrolase [Streptosporangiaceae bacterium]
MSTARPARPVSCEELAGSHVLLTGATGFLGQATLERLLASYPDTHVSVLIRPRGERGAADRLSTLLRKNVFRPLSERLGADELVRVVRERVTVIEGDLGSVALPADLDVVIHGASTVSFDPPVDEAFRTNVSGVATLYEALAGSPHVVHVSTAYVAGTRKGVVAEAALDHDVDWQLELEMALAARADVERDSRRPEVLRRALAQADEQHAKAGPQSTAAAAERLRTKWVTRRLVDYGRTRARSLGWPDVYTLTKALGERVAEQRWAHTGRPLSVVRPAIVESALRHPYPGWIDGFKMADPLIIAYGRGVLREFPGLPDSVLDVIPVDLVINAILAAAARPPATGPAYLHVSSGASNPLTFQNMYMLCREYFDNHPMPDGDRGHVEPPTWRFPGSQQVELTLHAGERVTALAERVLLRLPPSKRSQDWLTSLGRQQQDLGQLREYADLYGVYTRAEVIYDDTRLRELHAALPAQRATEHGFDPTVIDWRAYLQDVHCPSITATVRRAGQRRGRSTAGHRGSPSQSTSISSLSLPERTDVAAVFDLEGTIVNSNVVESYLWARLATMPRSGWLRELADLARCAPRYLYAERRDRGELLRAFLRRYAGVRADALRALVTEVLGDVLLHRVMPEATRQIRRHRAAGHRTVLITGAVDLHVEPLSVLFDEVVASRMHVKDGVLTGFLEAPPLVDEARAAWLRQYAQGHGLHLDRSYAYADSYSDRPLLEAVGHPHAVNPDSQLFRHARRRRWVVHRWGEHTGGLLEVLLDVTRADVRIDVRPDHGTRGVPR